MNLSIGFSDKRISLIPTRYNPIKPFFLWKHAHCYQVVYNECMECYNVTTYQTNCSCTVNRLCTKNVRIVTIPVNQTALRCKQVVYKECMVCCRCKLTCQTNYTCIVYKECMECQNGTTCQSNCSNLVNKLPTKNDRNVTMVHYDHSLEVNERGTKLCLLLIGRKLLFLACG